MKVIASQAIRQRDESYILRIPKKDATELNDGDYVRLTVERICGDDK